MHITAIKTRKFFPPKDNLFSLLKESFSRGKLKEKSIIVVTSKVVSIGDGRCVKISSRSKKPDLIKREADWYVDKNKIGGKISTLTIKDNILVSSSGIDESNGNGYYILWPRKPFVSAQKICRFIKKQNKIRQLGVVISDSHRIPLRVGIVGMALAYAGFWPLRDYRGKRDIFGRTMKFSQSNVADSLAAAAALEMGEGGEQTPFAVVEEVGHIAFTNRDFRKKDLLKSKIHEDKYAPMLAANIWKRRK